MQNRCSALEGERALLDRLRRQGGGFVERDLVDESMHAPVELLVEADEVVNEVTTAQVQRDQVVEVLAGLEHRPAYGGVVATVAEGAELIGALDHRDRMIKQLLQAAL